MNNVWRAIYEWRDRPGDHESIKAIDTAIDNERAEARRKERAEVRQKLIDWLDANENSHGIDGAEAIDLVTSAALRDVLDRIVPEDALHTSRVGLAEAVPPTCRVDGRRCDRPDLRPCSDCPNRASRVPSRY